MPHLFIVCLVVPVKDKDTYGHIMEEYHHDHHLPCQAKQGDLTLETLINNQREKEHVNDMTGSNNKVA